MNNSIRVVIADDDPIVLFGLTRYLSVFDELVVVAECADGPSLLEAVAYHDVDVALIDVQLGAQNGLDMARRLASEAPRVRPMLISSLPMDDVLTRALDAGVAAVLPKAAPPETFVAAIRAAHAGCVVIHRELLPLDRPATVAGDYDLPEAGPADLTTRLTSREVDVLELIAEARTNRQIATRMGVTESTVKTHLSNIFAKTGVQSRGELIRLFLDGRFAQPG